jgi:hypothetical protein
MQNITVESKTLEEYWSLRVRVRDFIHLALLWHRVTDGPDPLAGYPTHGPDQLADTLRTATLGWFASLVDPHPNALNAFRIWRRIFPLRKLEIKAVEAALRPHNESIQAFRNNVAFHSSKSVEQQLQARAGIMNQSFIDASDQFLGLAQRLFEEGESTDGLQPNPDTSIGWP